MRQIARSVLCVMMMSLCLPLRVHGQDAPQRDAQAIALLQKMTSAAGWPADNSLQDVTVHATITITPLKGAVHSDQVVIKARSSDEKVHVDNLTTGASMYRLDEFAIYRNGKTVRPIPWLSMEHLYGAFIPFLMPVHRFANSDRELLYKGQQDVNGASAYVVSTRQTDTTTGTRADLRRRASQMTLSISTATLLPLQSEIEMTLSNYTARIPTTIQYTNYQQVDGISVPFEINVQPKGQASFQIVIQSLQWNTGLTEGDFIPQ